MPFSECAEGRAGLDGLQLLHIADEDDLGASPLRMAQHPLHLARADHAGLIDDQHIVGTEPVAVVRPAVLETGEGP